jgi:hypothetical protein
MKIIPVLKLCVAAVFSLIGLIGLYIMFTAETKTLHDFEYYFRWAMGAGMVFIAVGAALTAFDREDAVVTEFDEKVKR